MRLFHVTKRRTASKILKSGFSESTTMIGGTPISGVWFSDAPWLHGGNVELGQLPDDLACVVIELHGQKIRQYELVEEGSTYRHWCIPAAMANSVKAIPAGSPAVL